jgi:hypothetical protein
MHGKRWRRIAAAAIAVGALSSGRIPGGHWSACLAHAQSAGSSAEPGAATPAKANGQAGWQQRRELQRKEYMRQHSDATGTVRPDLELKGVQHMHRMKVAPTIGSHPDAPSPQASTAETN